MEIMVLAILLGILSANIAKNKRYSFRGLALHPVRRTDPARSQDLPLVRG